MKKRILHLLNTSSYSGAENVVISIIKNLSNDYECVYASMDGPIREALDRNGIGFIPVKKITISEVQRINKQYKPDLIHAHDYRTSITCAFSNINTKIISHLHNNSPWIKTYHPYSFIYLVSSLRYKKILTVSDTILQEYIFGKRLARKAFVISNPVDINSIISKSKQKESHNKEFDIVFLGRLTHAKNPLRFIDLMQKIIIDNPELRVAIIGDGNLRRQCQEKINSLDIEKNISMLGFLDNPYITLARAKVLCMTSIWEGFGLAAIEGLALGIPVVATPVGGLKEIINEHCGLLTNDDTMFVEEVKKLVLDKEYRYKKSQNALDRAYELNNIRSYVYKLKSIYENILNDEWK